MWRSRGTLIKYGVVYPENIVGKWYNSTQHFTHAFLADALRNRELVDHLDAIIGHYGEKDYFFSSEDFIQMGPPRRDQLVDVLKTRFTTINVIIYLRDPASLVVSHAAQMIRHGWTMQQMVENPPIFPYRREVTDWWTRCGRQHVFVRPYGVREVTADVLEVIGLPPEAVPIRNWGNPTPSAEAVFAVHAARKAGRSWDGLSGIPGRPFTLPSHVVDKAVEMSGDDLRWLEDELGLVLPTKHVRE